MIESPAAPPLAEESGPAGAPAQRLAGRPGLGVVTLDGAGGGVAYLGRLTRRALADLAEAPPRVAALAPATLGSVSRGEAARYLLRLAAAQASGATDWWIFNHVGVARPQSRLPAPLRRPYALWLCGVEAWDPALPPGRRRAMQSAAVRIAISAHTAARVRATHPDVGEIRVCPLALLPPEPVRGEPDRDLLRRIGPRAVCIVGRMSAAERYKGHDELLECWPGVISAVPDAQLVVVGAGDDAARLRGRAAELGIGDAVLFTGFVSDATREAVLERAAAFAMPSRGEGFGLVYLEAMRLGVPCIGSTVDAAREVVADGETGFTIDPDDRGALASSIVRLLSDEGARRAMGEAGRARYEAHFTYARFRERLGGLLGETFGSLP